MKKDDNSGVALFRKPPKSGWCPWKPWEGFWFRALKCWGIKQNEVWNQTNWRFRRICGQPRKRYDLKHENALEVYSQASKWRLLKLGRFPPNKQETCVSPQSKPFPVSPLVKWVQWLYAFEIRHVQEKSQHPAANVFVSTPQIVGSPRTRFQPGTALFYEAVFRVSSFAPAYREFFSQNWSKHEIRWPSLDFHHLGCSLTTSTEQSGGMV